MWQELKRDLIWSDTKPNSVAFFRILGTKWYIRFSNSVFVSVFFFEFTVITYIGVSEEEWSFVTHQQQPKSRSTPFFCSSGYKLNQIHIIQTQTHTHTQKRTVIALDKNQREISCVMIQKYRLCRQTNKKHSKLWVESWCFGCLCCCSKSKKKTTQNSKEKMCHAVDLHRLNIWSKHHQQESESDGKLQVIKSI